MQTSEIELLSELLSARKQRRRSVMVTVVETKGSTPRKAGARMLAYGDGSISGTIGGGAVEHTVREAVCRAFDTLKPELVQFNLCADLGMGCGGNMTLFVEPIVPNPVLIVCGCGHIGAALIRTALPLGFDIVAVDDLEANLTRERIGPAAELVASYNPDDYDDLPADEDTYVVIATRAHAIDERLLRHFINRPQRYLGVIGSTRKANKQRQKLEADGISTEALDQLACPIGIDIGAETPEEIAVSICAQLVAVRRKGK